MKYLFLPILSLLFVINCVTTPIPGYYFTYTTQHLNGDATGNMVTSAKLEKSGKSCSFSGFVVNLFFYGAGNSIEEASQHANIQKIAVVDRESLTILPFGIFYRECVIVWGE
ncbi:TRL-like family protein [Leptospira sp. 2 VSF19]|uniref:TRL-like family protein n=1 Tax=Leptospira soteropolitanensis TaxID=2950025 RepID=A0AAW5VGL4_9LEPT|nr:TRL domain-containing protein [Leptospira soteropolitanensis]MCW7491932.1 TRL-like family protein [Leptospira soteropolitanensis]MCW7499516.1 TRL-like family protein [Leptospira soteropolitanensis]MCW7520893.1 TRL-like family protein [Leptospira soteropolitanensis]MCW7525620.1 TRL-like family protein [Leptospira soteropolitanensis]MCW7529486.1 TRL-like family protein [Leptospira soteropolitanensis]